MTPHGNLVPLEEWFANQPEGLYADPVHRLHALAGSLTGDLLLLSDYAAGFYFGGVLSGMHGGLHPEDSHSTLAFGWPGSPQASWEKARGAFTQAIDQRCQSEGGRQPSTADLMTGLLAVLPG